MERRAGRLASIGEIIEERNIVLRGADALPTRGFTQVPNHILDNGKLSPGAKLAYAMLLKYAWRNDYCFPGQERLAHEMGVTDRSVRTYLQELQKREFVAIKRQDLGKPSLDELNLTRRGAPSPDRKIFPVKTGINRRSGTEEFSD